MRLLALLVLLTGCVSAQDWTVAPGSGVGDLRLGMSRKAAAGILTPTEEIGQFVRYGPELLVEYHGGAATMITLNKNSLRTRSGPIHWVPYKGAAIGVPWSSVVGQIPGTPVSKELKTPKGYPKQYYHAYLKLGLGIRVEGPKIVQIDIWDKK